MEIFIILLLVLIICAFVFWYLFYQKGDNKSQDFGNLKQNFNQVQQDFGNLKQNFNQVQQEKNQLEIEKTELNTLLRERVSQMEEFKEKKEELGNKVQELEQEKSGLRENQREKETLLQAEKEKQEFLKAELEKQKKTFEEELDKKLEQAQNYELKVEKLGNKIHQLEQEKANLESDQREKETQLQGEKEKLEEIKAQFEKQKESLKTEFKAVSEEIMKERQRLLNEQNNENMNALLNPLKQQIEGFKTRVNEVHTKSVEGHTSLKEEIKKVLEVGLTMKDEAARLTSALKGDSQKIGAWGEAQLERTLEMSGLIEGEHYETQKTYQDKEGKNKRTDFLIKLPDEKHIIIDSKVSLNSYDKALSKETDEERKEAMDEFVRSVKRHIDDLASKDYPAIKSIGSPNFTLMFMPIEPAYIEALKYDRSLFGYGYDKNVILVSHTTLIPILRTIANLWKIDKSHKEARKISEKAGDIYDSVSKVFERFEKLGSSLNTASNHYNDTVTALAGTRGLERKVKQFKEIANTTKQIPKIEPKTMQFDNSRLKLHKD